MARSIKKGKVDTLLEWIDVNKNKLYKMSWAYLKNHSDVEDVFHNAIIKVMENADKLKKEEAFEAWFISILLNECRKVLRDNKRVLPAEDIEISSDFMDNLSAGVNKTSFNKKKKIKPLRTILIAAVILTLSVATVFAAKEPILELFKLINPQPRITTMVDKGVGNRLNISKTDKDIKITITDVLADDLQTLISYKIEDLKSGKYYNVPYADGISIDERWGETAEYSNMEMYTSQFNFEDKGTLKLFAIDTEEKNIHLTFKKLTTSNEGNLETIEGKWDFELPIKKYSGKSYDLNSTIKVDNYTFDLKQSFDCTKYKNISYTFQPQEGHSAEKYFSSGYNSIHQLSLGSFYNFNLVFAKDTVEIICILLIKRDYAYLYSIFNLTSMRYIKAFLSNILNVIFK